MKSNCCQAPLVEETDVCSKCQEHCEVLDEKVDYIELLKQFDKSELVEVFGRFLNINKDEKLTTFFCNDLHAKKYNRLIDVLGKKLKTYEVDYECYNKKIMPKKVEPFYAKFIIAFKKTERDLEKQRKVMVDRGLIEEK